MNNGIIANFKETSPFRKLLWRLHEIGLVLCYTRGKKFVCTSQQWRKIVIKKRGLAAGDMQFDSII